MQQAQQPQQVQMQQPQQLQANYYGKGIAVYGPTQAWKEDLKAMGGKYNSNLGGQPGWIFGAGREQALMQFIANANAGAIMPTPVPAGARSPYRAQQVQQAVQQPYVAQPIFQQPYVAQPGLPAIQPIVRPVLQIQPAHQIPQAQRMSPLVATNAESTSDPSLLRFKDQSGQVYEIQWYAVPVPELGQQVHISYTDVDEPIRPTYLVSEMPDERPINTFAILEEETGNGYEVDLVRGEWQIRGQTRPHTVDLLHTNQ